MNESSRCLTLAVSIDGSDVLTIEGIAAGETLDQIQEAFIDHDGFQCGYCTPGQISSAHAVLREHARGDLSMMSFEGGRQAVINGCTPLTEQEMPADGRKHLPLRRPRFQHRRSHRRSREDALM